MYVYIHTYIYIRIYMYVCCISQLTWDIRLVYGTFIYRTYPNGRHERKRIGHASRGRRPDQIESWEVGGRGFCSRV
jgi:hypothetical protein